MAFDSAGGGGGGGGGGGAPLSGASSNDTLSWLTQRIRSVQATSESVASLGSQVGGAGDTPALRSRLEHQCRLGNTYMGEIEPVLLRYRGELAQAEKARGASLPAAQSLRRLEEGYGAVKGRLLEVSAAALARCREVRVRAPAVPEADARGALKQRSAAPAVVVVENQLRQLTQLTDADAEIAAERAQEARAIATESAVLTDAMRDLGALVHEQEEKLETVEAHVTSSAQAAEAGTQDVEKAASYVNACRWKACAAGLMVSSLVTTLLVLHFAVSPPLV